MTKHLLPRVLLGLICILCGRAFAAKPNIVFFLVDDLGHRDLGTLITTPILS